MSTYKEQMDKVNVELKKTLSENAKRDLRAFSKFYLWASPLFQLGHIVIKGNAVLFSQVISKRILIGMSQNKNTDNKDEKNNIPSIAFQASELAWVKDIPWASAAINFKTKTLLLVAKPEAPLNSIVYMIQIDSIDKIENFNKANIIQIINIPGLMDSEDFHKELKLKELREDEYKAKLKAKASPYAPI